MFRGITVYHVCTSEGRKKLVLDEQASSSTTQVGLVYALFHSAAQPDAAVAPHASLT